jgi:hypothetical protein
MAACEQPTKLSCSQLSPGHPSKLVQDTGSHKFKFVRGISRLAQITKLDVQCNTIAEAEQHAVTFLNDQLRSHSSPFWQIILQGNPAQEFSLGVGGAGDANKAIRRLRSHGAGSEFKR